MVVFISIYLRDELIFGFGKLKLALKHISNTVYFSPFIIIASPRRSYYTRVCQPGPRMQVVGKDNNTRQ